MHIIRCSARPTWFNVTLPCGIAMVVPLLAGCGGGDDASRTLTPSIGSCAAGWQTLFTLSDGLEPTSLALTDDALFFRTFEGTIADFNDGRALIRALSLRDGLLRTVVEAQPEVLWVEDGTLLYSSRDSLFSVALEGGVPQLMLDGASSTAGSHGFHTGLDSQHFYWRGTLDAPGLPLTIWRMPRAGGGAEVFASLPDFDHLSARVWLGSEGLLVADRGRSDLVPLDASAAIPLAEVTSPDVDLLGFDALGTYWRSGSSDSDIQILRAPVTGGPLEPFWPEMPEGFFPWSLWSDGRGGWQVSGHEPFDDGIEHYEIWSLDADENANRVACDPGVNFVGEVADPVFTSTAAYQIMRQGRNPTIWSIVEVSLD